MDLPSTVGPYKILSLLGQGPLTVVYHAEHEQLHRQVALKHLRGTIAADSALASAINREAHLLSKLSHPGIPTLYEFHSSRSTLWIAFELISGPNLSVLIEKSPKGVAPEVVIAILIGLASILAYLHKKQVIHSDIQPSNVLISPDGKIHLVDFARAHSPWLPMLSEPIDPAGAGGSPAYQSPEQIIGDECTSASDLFSLGVLGYHLLTGQRPFDGPDVRTVTQRLRHDTPVPVRSISPNVPAGLERFVEICLSKSPADRFESAEEALQALQDCASQLPSDGGRELLATMVHAGLFDPKVLPPVTPTGPAPKKQLTIARAAMGQLLSLAAMIGGATLIQTYVYDPVQSSKRSADPSRPLELLPEKGGNIRVVARPWASVYVDGQYIDVTPFARPIPLRAGTHQVSFRHPNAPEETRAVQVQSGQSTFVEVEMSVPPPPKSSAPLFLARVPSPIHLRFPFRFRSAQSLPNRARARLTTLHILGELIDKQIWRYLRRLTALELENEQA